MFNAVNNLSSADLQNVDARSTRTKDVIFILADLKNVNWVQVRGEALSLHVNNSTLHLIELRLEIL